MPDTVAALWTLPEFSADQIDKTKWKYAWRWVGAGTSSTATSNDEQEASDAYQKVADDPSVCSCEYYVDGVLASYFFGTGKAACPEAPAPDVTAYFALPWHERHSRALRIGAGVLTVVGVIGTVLFVRRKRKR